MKTLYTTLLILFVTLNSFAQKLDKEKIKALKIAHITEQLDLTEKEAQVFWPIYNANSEIQNKLREESSKRRKEKKAEDLTETEAKELLLFAMKNEKEKQELQAKYINNLLTVLPAKKVIALMRADRSFRKKMIEEFKQRHRGEKRDSKN